MANCKTTPLSCKESPCGQSDITTSEVNTTKYTNRQQKKKNRLSASVGNSNMKTPSSIKYVNRKRKRRARLSYSIVHSSSNTSTHTNKQQKRKAGLRSSKLQKNIHTSTNRKTVNRKPKKTSLKHKAETQHYLSKLSRLATLQRSKLHRVPHLSPLYSNQNRNISMRALNCVLKSACENIHNKPFTDRISKEMVENVCSLASETLNTKVYQSLRKEQKVNLSNNLKYMRDIIGISCTGTSYLQHQSTPEIPGKVVLLFVVCVH